MAHSCLTLCNPTNYSFPGSFVHGISQTRKLEWVAISFFRGSYWPRDQTCIFPSPVLQKDSLTQNHQGTLSIILEFTKNCWELLQFSDQFFSTRDGFTSQGIFDNFWRHIMFFLGWYPTYIWLMEVRNAIKHPTMQDNFPLQRTILLKSPALPKLSNFALSCIVY